MTTIAIQQRQFYNDSLSQTPIEQPPSLQPSFCTRCKEQVVWIWNVTYEKLETAFKAIKELIERVIQAIRDYFTPKIEPREISRPSVEPSHIHVQQTAAPAMLEPTVERRALSEPSVPEPGPAVSVVQPSVQQEPAVLKPLPQAPPPSERLVVADTLQAAQEQLSPRPEEPSQGLLSEEPVVVEPPKVNRWFSWLRRQ